MEFAIIFTICFVVLFGCYLTLVNLIPHLKNKKREKIERTQKEMVFNKRKALEKAIKDKISDVDFGSLGKISKENIDMTKLYILSCIERDEESLAKLDYIYDTWLDIDEDICLARLCDIVNENWEEIKEETFEYDDILIELFN